MTMLLPQFELHKPTSLKEALDLARGFGDDFDYLSGGTDLLPNYKCGLNASANVISLAHIAELKAITPTEIGAGVCLRDLERSKEIPASVAYAASQIASPLIRESATLGGNLMLDTRCHFFNQSYFWRRTLGYCLKADGDVCHVIPKIMKDGKSVTNSFTCVATHSSDLAPLLVALGATCTLAGPAGTRTLKLSEFYRGDGIARFDLQRGEIFTKVTLPKDAASLRSGYKKLAPRRSIDFPVLGVAAALGLGKDGRVESLRIGLGACETIPVLYDFSGKDKQAERGNAIFTEPTKGMPEVIGKKLDDALIQTIADHVTRTAQPKLNVPMEPAYRKKMAGVLARRLLTELRTTN
ncbi:MAG: FAD binding domain-containing protein [Planctomycetes bacterium]|nr:FAD binding domain-containing protein [Planctomycetota bacterium]